MGGGYTNVLPIPVDDPDVRNIAGAWFKPDGPGPFPVVIYMGGCAGLSAPAEKPLQQSVIDHLLQKGIATLIVDPFTPRQEQGVCDKVKDNIAILARGAKDVGAALSLVRLLPDVDRNRIFLQGYSYGAFAALLATDPGKPVSKDVKVAGVVAYYPYCRKDEVFGAPTLVLIGDKDDWTPANLCEAIKDRPNVDVVVFPGVTHGFVMPMKQPVDFLGHHMAYDAKAAAAAQQRADAFLDERVRPTIGTDDLLKLLTNAAGWRYEQRQGLPLPGRSKDTSTNLDATIVFRADGERMVAKIANDKDQPNLTAGETCEKPVTITGDTLVFDNCFRPGVRLRFDPTDKEFPLKGGTSSQDVRLKPM
jgi:dienelactone hydrolase